MKQIINNEGVKITISERTYKLLQLHKEEGFFSVVICDASYNTHVVLTENI